MLTILGERHRFCDRLSRRNFLQIGGLALGGMSMPEILQAEAAAVARERDELQAEVAAAREAREQARAESEALKESLAELRAIVAGEADKQKTLPSDGPSDERTDESGKEVESDEEPLLARQHGPNTDGRA